MTQFELWLKGCEMNSTALYCLEGDGATGIYKTQQWHFVGNNYCGDSPVYHVWIDGERKCCILNYHSAMQVWRNRKGGD